MCMVQLKYIPRYVYTILIGIEYDTRKYCLRLLQYFSSECNIFLYHTQCQSILSNTVA